MDNEFLDNLEESLRIFDERLKKIEAKINHPIDGFDTLSEKFEASIKDVEDLANSVQDEVGELVTGIIMLHRKEFVESLMADERWTKQFIELIEIHHPMFANIE